MSHRKIAAVRRSCREDVGYLEQHLPLSGMPGETHGPFLILGHHGPQRFEPNNRGMPFSPHLIAALRLSPLSSRVTSSTVIPGGTPRSFSPGAS